MLQKNALGRKKMQISCMGSKVPFWKNWKIAKIPTYLTFFSFKFRFTVPEEEEPGYFVGKVEANDPDEGKNGRVFYYIIDVL